MLKKNPKFDIKSKYRKVFEVSFVIALFLVIVAFKTFPKIEQKRIVRNSVQEIIITEDDVYNTKIDMPKPPPPPKPVIPIETLTDEDLEDVIFIENELVLNEEVGKPKLFEEKDNTEDFIFIPVAEVMPEPIGGISEIQKKIIYPEIAKRAGVQGRVYIKAFVDEKGNVIKTEIIKGIGAGCDEAAITAVMKTKFKPGKQRGKPVRVQVSIPILFKLN
jgi:protein TonB